MTSSQPPTRDIVVPLLSNYTSGLTVPATVTIHAGQTTATFDVTMHDDRLIQGNRPVVVTAAVENWTSGSATLSDIDDDRTIAVIAPSDVWEGQGVLHNAGTVRLGEALPSALTVPLSTSDSGHLGVPFSVTIPAGQTSQNFDLSIVDDLAANHNRPVTVTAVASGFTNATQSVVIHDNELDHFAWDAIASPEDVQVSFVATARAKNLDNDTIPTYAGTAALVASGDHGANAVTPATCTFAGGVWTGRRSDDKRRHRGRPRFERRGGAYRRQQFLHRAVARPGDRFPNRQDRLSAVHQPAYRRDGSSGGFLRQHGDRL